MRLLHGTTRVRAEEIIRVGPNPRFRERGGAGWNDGFSMTLEDGPFPFGKPEDYAVGKAMEFPDEGGPVILVVDVPEEIVDQAANEWFPLEQGLVQFDVGAGLEELMDAWANLFKEIRSVT